MSEEPENPSAFPVIPQVMRNPLNIHEQVFHQGSYGMSLRDYFAAAALQGFTANKGWLGYFEHEEHRQFLLSTFAKDSYAIADAMLAARANS